MIGGAAAGRAEGRRAVAIVAAVALAAALAPATAWGSAAPSGAGGSVALSVWKTAAPAPYGARGGEPARSGGRGAPAAAPVRRAGRAGPPARRLPGALRVATADRVLLARLLAASKVDRRPQPPDASYLRDLAAMAFARLAELIDRTSLRLRLPKGLLRGGASLLVAAAAALLARSWWLRRRRLRAAGGGAGGEGAARAAAAAAGAAGSAAGLPAPGSERWDAAAWRFELERLLALGGAREALRAVWWWLARSLAGDDAEATWTGRELLRRSGREDLAGLVRRLDGLTYGPRRPAIEEVGELAARLEAALA
jgi:hypothetical protein